MTRSNAIFSRATQVLPGGVNSPVRAFRAVGGTPLVLRSGTGCRVQDEDGNNYLDFVGSWGPLILGHAHPEVVAAVHEAVGRGMTFGAPCRAEVQLAEAVVDAYPGIEQLRCVSSGTEAVMSAIRLARGCTGRDVIVKFSGCYHGHADHLLVSAGSGLATFGEPSSAGVPRAFADLTRVLPLDDEEKLDALFAKEGDHIAAVVIEPLPANNGLLIQRPEFLQHLRKVTEKHGTLLIFDEVISGFRVARGGCAELYGITPDMATFGKIIGGGMPVGAFGGSRDVMGHLAPDGPVYQAGTLSGNPVAMAAGLATLKVLDRDGAWAQLEERGAELEKALQPVLNNAPVEAHLVREGSIFWISFQEGEGPRSAEAIRPEAADVYRKFFQGLLKLGVTIAPSAYEVGFVSTAHEAADITEFVNAVEGALVSES